MLNLPKTNGTINKSEVVIVLADDAKMMTQIWGMLLSKLNYAEQNIHVVKNGIELVNKVNELEDQVHLIITDTNMRQGKQVDPALDSPFAINALRRSGFEGAILATSDSKEPEQDTMDAGATSFVTKMALRKGLEKTVSDVLEQAVIASNGMFIEITEAEVQEDRDEMLAANSRSMVDRVTEARNRHDQLGR